jgi:hypothetical protein
MAIMLAILVASQTPALAHRDVNHDGRDYATVSEDHLGALVSDEERDGKLVTGYFKLETSDWVQADDTDGANGSCALLQFEAPVLEFAVCETGNDCDMEWP